jgi:radical SAM superfamily enzyme YgiQ (UPF0313 family)
MRRRSKGLSRHELLAAERGTARREAPHTIALVYPSPYRTAMSSLGYQTIYRLLNELPGFAADRAMLPEEPGPLETLERGRPVGDYPLLAFSVAYELEIAGLIECLERAGIAPLARDRTDADPIVIAGGPLTFSNPVPLAPFCDLVVMGEGEELIAPLVEGAADAGWRRGPLLARFAGVPGFYVPEHDGDRLSPVAAAANHHLPARSQIMTPHTELADMFLTEAVRGCSRGCTYCVMRRSTNGGMRMVDPDELLAHIPGEATRVGLVGASVTDHPRIAEIVRGVVDGGRQVGISSLRADKLDDELVGLLARGGYRTLTTASDGASERMRRVIERSTNEGHLRRCAELARKHKLHTLKLYMMLGIPGETDEDIEELIRFTLELAAIHRVALGIAPFVAKRNTPLDGTPFAGIDVVQRRLTRLRRGLKGRAEIRPTSARWAWVEYMIAQGGSSAGLAILDAHRGGGGFAAYKRAFAARGVEPTGPLARVPSSSELVALKRRERQIRAAQRL